MNVTAGSSRVAVRVVAGVISAAAGLLWAFCVFTVVSARFTTDPAHDPHGYGLIFGSVLALATGLIAAMMVPFAFPARRRPRVTLVAMATYVICSALLVTAWFTAS